MNSEFIQLLKGTNTRMILINSRIRINIKNAYWLILPDCNKLTRLLKVNPKVANPEGPKISIKPLSTNLYVIP